MLLVSAGELRFLVLHVGEDLVQVAGVDALLVELLLRRVTVVLRVDDEDGPAPCERYVGVHGGEHIAEAVVERPADVRRPRGKLWVLTSVVLADELLVQLPGVSSAKVVHLEFPELPELEIQGIYGEAALEKQEWKSLIKEQVKKILKYKPEAVFVGENLFAAYPIVHSLRKKHIPVLTLVQKDGKKLIVRIPSGS